MRPHAQDAAWRSGQRFAQLYRQTENARPLAFLAGEPSLGKRAPRASQDLSLGLKIKFNPDLVYTDARRRGRRASSRSGLLLNNQQQVACGERVARNHGHVAHEACHGRRNLRASRSVRTGERISALLLHAPAFPSSSR